MRHCTAGVVHLLLYVRCPYPTFATYIPLISEIMAQVLLGEKGGSKNSQSGYINQYCKETCCITNAR